jgi:hypothetical protein
MANRWLLVPLATLALTSSACIVVDGPAPGAHPVVHGGPPPHAPAHGHRHKHRGHDLRYDSDLGVYVVVDLGDVWFLDGSYFRISGDHWEIAVAAAGPWRVATRSAVPVHLYQKRHPHGGPPGQSKKGGNPNGKAK